MFMQEFCQGMPAIACRYCDADRFCVFLSMLATNSICPEAHVVGFVAVEISDVTETVAGDA